MTLGYIVLNILRFILISAGFQVYSNVYLQLLLYNSKS